MAYGRIVVPIMTAHRPNILLILSDQHNPKIAGFAGDALAETA